MTEKEKLPREGDPGTWSHCGVSSPHRPHLFDVIFQEGRYTDVQCNGIEQRGRSVAEHKLQVTVVYTIDVENLADYEATTVEEAARNLQDWYARGEAYPAEDLASMEFGDTGYIKVEAVK